MFWHSFLYITALFKIAPSPWLSCINPPFQPAMAYLPNDHIWYRGQGGILCQPSGTSYLFCLDIKMFSFTKFMTKMCFPDLGIFWHDQFTELRINHMVRIVLKQKEGTSGCFLKTACVCFYKVSLVAVKGFMRCSYTRM